MNNAKGSRLSANRLRLSLCCALLAAAPLLAQQSAEPGFEAGAWLPPNEPFDIRLSGEGTAKIAVLVDTLDVTSLFDRVEPGVARFRGEGPVLPAGDRTLTVYRVDESGEWTQIGQFPIRFLSKRGFQKVTVTPTTDLAGEAQVGESHSPDSNAPPRDEFQDGTMQLALRSELVRPAFTIRTEGQVSGVTYQNEALRFGSEGESAPKVDLSSYRIELERGSTLLSVGHVGYGSFRHLANFLQSRGIALTLGQGRTVSLQLAALNGSSIVGWDNFFGLQNSEHQMLGATFGFEAIAKSPGKLRFEAGLFQGSVQPITSFNQGGVVTAEESEGVSLRLLSADPSGRWRIDGAWTTSDFDDGNDEEVEGGLTVTPIESERDDAYYLDTSFGLLTNRKVGTQTANLTLNLRASQVNPFFRSIGAPVQANIRNEGGDLQLGLGSASGMLSYAQSRDNLGKLDSVLTSRMRQWTLNMSVPLGTMLAKGGAPPRWAPMLSLQAATAHQFGDGIPEGGGFTIESIPDMAAWNAMLSAEWQLGVWRLGGRLGGNGQDNRQVGSERNDFDTSNYALTFGWTPNQTFSFGGEVGMDATENVAAAKTDNTLRWLGNLNWTVWKQVALAASVTNVHDWDDLDTRDQKSLNGFVELSSGFKTPSLTANGGRGRIFVRWTDQSLKLTDRTFGLTDDRDSSTITTGLTLSIF